VQRRGKPKLLENCDNTLASSAIRYTIRSQSKDAQMKLTELKQKVFQEWERHCSYNCIAIPSDKIVDLFKQKVREFGNKDLRFKETWISALAYLRASNISEACTDSYLLVTTYFNPQLSSWDYEFRHRIFDEFMKLDGMLDAIRHGLEQCGLVIEERFEYGILELVAGSTK